MIQGKAGIRKKMSQKFHMPQTLYKTEQFKLLPGRKSITQIV